ncbi:unnamed protein product [Paramecium primaurelia]|uniref:Uncharacterized protein n=1 Tax=Paramecium primaurelia TaxID=5886 RepID=A0A8S1MY13_PARPR|nr:unnamed protein product [Paramecium primaurelia]CAD8085746.1 unnamed protein product [Paramecium primaurelia]CAD8085747.1 unnamed protein product [Paramecium primaurelia]
MGDLTILKRKFESLSIVDEEAPQISKKNFIQDGELYILGKKISSINLVTPLQHIINKPDIVSTCLALMTKDKYNPFMYIDRPIKKANDEQQ